MSAKIPKEIREMLEREGERVLRSLNTPKGRRAALKAIRATPEELGNAAVWWAGMKKKKKKKR